MINYLPIYKDCFATGLNPKQALKKLESSPSSTAPDFSISDSSPPSQQGWLASLLMIPLYPAQSRLAQSFISKYKVSHLDKIKNIDRQEMERQGTHFHREVVLEKNGIRYRGYMMGRKENINNGKWVLQAMGRNCPVERAIRKCRNLYSEAGFNVLMINGPSIGRSEGSATPRALGEAQEAGLRFLETALNAKQIAIAGHSIGGAVIGQAILQHEFKKQLEYLVIRQCTFSQVSQAAHRFFPYFRTPVQSLIKSAEIDMDNIEASKKLAELGIKEVIIQAGEREGAEEKSPALGDFGSDGIIAAEASLGYNLVKEKILRNKKFRLLPHLDHRDSSRYLKATCEELAIHFKTKTIWNKLLSIINL